MAHRVVWSPTALEDVEAIAAYISRDSISYAAAVVKRILDSTRSLQEFPHVGRAVPEFDDTGIREIFVYSFRVIYHIESETVIIASVVHGKRLLNLVPDNPTGNE
jgi:addiction module RelE/StbE family toxin